MQLSPIPPQRHAQIVIPQDVPVYTIKSTFFCEGHLYTEGNVIAFDGEPNEEMEPMNELAVQAMHGFFDKLDKLQAKVAERLGTAFVSRADAFENARLMAKQDEKSIRLITGKEQVPVFSEKAMKPKNSRRLDGPTDVPHLSNNVQGQLQNTIRRGRPPKAQGEVSGKQQVNDSASAGEV